MRETGTPIWVGEFGPVYTGDPRGTSSATGCSRTSSRSTREHGASWALWTYKDIGLQGLVHADPGRRTCSGSRRVLEKKARLGVDSWGSDRRGLRHILEPIERLFATEFPDFQPYPWGAARWIHGHIRHVMLAEAMVDEYAAAFAGLTLDEARDLADAFSLANARTRSRLADIIRSTAP